MLLQARSAMCQAATRRQVKCAARQTIARHPPQSQRRCSRTAVLAKAQYSPSTKGQPETLEYRCFIQQKGQSISPWHDIPLNAENGQLNFVCEIPKESSAKMEVATIMAPAMMMAEPVFPSWAWTSFSMDEDSNPIKQDIKKGKLRFYPYNINWNYGLLPQTWEDPTITHPDLGAAGDNDPVDVVEIGEQQLRTGSVHPVKPLAVLAMIDDGELDWKVIAIRADDPRAASLNDVEDVEREMPGEIEKIRIWFRDYKTPDGKPQNKFGYDDKPQNKEFTMHVVQETHEAYKALKSGQRENKEQLALA